ncbi:rCG57467, isoform CRA_a [Rattus norvegicus]|uniref:RCG57467, isoform CRA_a n=1 Tax=Rattus norvegicus TaxID=10116 RepID=A6JI74_RAT|nr:rCG57467, isoform CRA_a [Rattus norvegicus]
MGSSAFLVCSHASLTARHGLKALNFNVDLTVQPTQAARGTGCSMRGAWGQ